MNTCEKCGAGYPTICAPCHREARPMSSRDLKRRIGEKLGISLTDQGVVTKAELVEIYRALAEHDNHQPPGG